MCPLQNQALKPIAMAMVGGGDQDGGTDREAAQSILCPAFGLPLTFPPALRVQQQALPWRQRVAPSPLDLLAAALLNPSLLGVAVRPGM